MDKRQITLLGQRTDYYSCNTVIVGTGASGYAAAVRLYEMGQKDILILTEGIYMGTSRNTGSDKQTYYKLNLCGDTEDSIEEMAKTYFHGESMDGDIALCEAANSLRCFFYLCELGVPFPFNTYGEYAGYKTDHDPGARATSVGPLTSKVMTECLQKRAEQYPIGMLNGAQVVSVLRDEEKCLGLLALEINTGKWILINAVNVVYATGGPAGIYQDSVYPASQSGGTGAALLAGVKGKNLTEWQYGLASIRFRWNVSGSYQQVLPRYVSTKQDGSDPREFLGAGFSDVTAMLEAQFLKGFQWPFDPRKTGKDGSSRIDLLVYREIAEKGRRVWMDFRENPSGLAVTGADAFGALGPQAREYLKNCDCLLPAPIDRLKRMNPGAAALYRANGIDLEREMLEVAVCAQHNNGGLSGDLWWESELRHFFPVGEVNGSHGVYRPGGSALNAGQVGALRAAVRITRDYADPPPPMNRFLSVVSPQAEQAFSKAAKWQRKEGIPPEALRRSLGSLMSRNCAHIRSADKAREAVEEIARLRRQLEEETAVQEPKQLAQAFRAEDLLITAHTLAQCILAYIRHGGGSRGSYLIQGAGLDEGRHAGEILEAQWRDGKLVTSWRPVRPIPRRDQWFETVWREFREAGQTARLRHL